MADPFICGSCDLVSDVVGSTQDPKAQPKKFQAEDSGWPAQPWQTVVGRVLFSLVFCVCLVLAVWQLANRHSSIANSNSSRTIGDAVTPLAGQKPGVLAPPVEGLVWPPRPQR